MEEIAAHTAATATSELLKQGILAVAAVTFALISMFLYKEKQKVEKRERVLYEKHAEKAEKWIEKYNDHAREMREVIASLIRRA